MALCDSSPLGAQHNAKGRDGAWEVSSKERDSSELCSSDLTQVSAADGLGATAMSYILRAYHHKKAEVRWNDTEKTLNFRALKIRHRGHWNMGLPTLKPTLNID